MELHDFGVMEESCVFVIMATSMHLYGRLISSAIRTRNLIASSVGRQATADLVTWSVRGLGDVHVTRSHSCDQAILNLYTKEGVELL